MSKLRIVIVGGVAGGASAAARARRISEDAEIIMFERTPHISFANCGLPYHIGGVIADRKRLLVQTPAAMKQRFNIDVRINSEVTAIDRGRKVITVKDLQAGRQYEEKYDKLILSPGAEAIRPNIPGMDLAGVFTLRNIADMDAIKSSADQAGVGKRAVIVGGGYIGLEMAENLRHRGMEVTLVELAPQIFSPIDQEMAWALHSHIRTNGIDLRLGKSINSISRSGDGLKVDIAGQSVDAAMVIVAIGVKPEAVLARDAGLETGKTGGIVVDEHMRTSDPDIYAVGDATEFAEFVSGTPAAIPLAGPANRQGRIAADNALGRDSTYRRTQGTAVCKIFDMTVALTGPNERTLKKMGRRYEKVYIHPANHAGYYPGATQMSLKLIFDPADGKIFGAQCVGIDGVDKRIDVLATAIRAGMTVYDLEHLELCYAPPYGSAKDPINYAGFVAANVLRGDVSICHTEDVLHPKAEQRVLDVRMEAELAVGVIPGSLKIPVDDLRGRIGELDKSKEYLIFCSVGLRGYVACRMLTQAGFRCRNLTGGYRTYQMVTDVPVAESSPKKEVKEDTGVMGSENAKLTCCGQPVEASGATEIDACGLQCPGPIMKLKAAIDSAAVGQRFVVCASDPGFSADVGAWCVSTGNELVELKMEGKVFRATVEKKAAVATQNVAAGSSNKQTIVVFSGDFDRVMAGFVLANAAASMGVEVTMFFTFWGLNALRLPSPPPVSKNLIEKMFGWMMPRGAGKLKLSKMDMLGAGRMMIKGVMKSKNISSLEELIASAQKAGVKLVACSMSMDVMGIKRQELIDGVDVGGAAMYLGQARQGNVNLFI